MTDDPIDKILGNNRVYLLLLGYAASLLGEVCASYPEGSLPKKQFERWKKSLEDVVYYEKPITAPP